MNNNLLGILKESVAFTKEMQPILKKQASCRRLATKVADDLVKYDIIDIEKRAQMENALADPEYAYDLITKLASRVPAESLGEPSDGYTKSAGLTPEDRLLNWILS